MWDDAQISKKRNLTDTVHGTSEIDGKQIQSFPKKIVASKENRKFLLNIDCILYFYYENNIVNIITDDNSIYHVNHSLSFWEEKLSNNSFVRCQKGYLVNIDKVVEIIPYFNSTLALKIKGHSDLVPVGRNFTKYFKCLIGW